MIVLKQIDPAETERRDGIIRDCLRLDMMPPPIARVSLAVYADQIPINAKGQPFDPQSGRVIADTREPAIVYEDYSRSWTRNAYNMLTMQMLGLAFNSLGTTFGAGYTTMKRVASNVQSTAYPGRLSVIGDVVGAVGDATYGIVVGTGTAAEDFDGYTLQTIVAHGNGAGQLSYTAQDATTAAYDAGTKKITATHARYCNNNSGGSIGINEVALYWLITNATASGSPYYSTYPFMMARDKLGSAVDVADTAQLKVTYTIDSPAYPA
jgi:hypothetical protein